ncbi:MAG TPA: hypothetical protein IAB46_02635 [Candidatus Scybalocola faecigallinarum]|uniref:Uncharacterized protein n=1 Tax=Candidatus Scybalocola faecigallinarum TaxID=2840941 RepID=A0A9D1F2H6_9FIRM|nr:hypothetical protein [Candidatus Scybalocola faecigallinarum]
MTLTPLTLFSVSPWLIVLIVILVILIAGIIFLSVWGKKQQKKMDESQKEIEANSQNMTMLIIDKKRMPLKQAGLPAIVVESTPKLLRRSKVPIVKAKVGPRIMVLIADEKIYDLIPIKQEVKATVSGIYITRVRSLRGPALVAPPKQKFRQRLKNKVLQKMSKNDTNSKNTANTKKKK